jgi:hypothetical protein
VTKEDGLQSDEKHATYAASKKYAELAVWEWAEAHPHIDVTISKSINYMVLRPLKLLLQISLNSTPVFHLRSISTQVSFTSEA